MPLASWYQHKADQSGRLAKSATGPEERANFKENQKLWLQILQELTEDETIFSETKYKSPRQS
ncbi:MAG: hypothetical protein Q8M24_15540 [Pseudolabrys sp.]|nr:hypothetical protein [Pseudolabrys sp.]MDP2296856.1 hypothetical protein [Pseudolabrys sp.]